MAIAETHHDTFAEPKDGAFIQLNYPKGVNHFFNAHFQLLKIPN